MRTTESSFLRQWAGSSLMPALLVWGMRHGTFIVDGAPMEIDQIAIETGYTRRQVQDMLAVADSMIVVEADNESSDNHRSNDR